MLVSEARWLEGRVSCQVSLICTWRLSQAALARHPINRCHRSEMRADPALLPSGEPAEVSQLKSLLFWRLGRLSYDVALVSTFFRNNRNSFHSASFFVIKDKLSVEFLFLAPTGAGSSSVRLFSQ
jgi:hypothetical protein